MNVPFEDRYYPPIVLEAAPQDAGKPLRQVLQHRLGISRRLMIRLKASDQSFLINGQPARPYTQVAPGDRIELRIEREESADIKPEPMALDIVYEDEHLLVVNKPAGQIVHPTTGHYVGTLANGIVHYWRERGERCRFHPVHRLDEWTSGLVVVAKHGYAHQQLAEQMAAGTVEKRYLAFVYGRPPQHIGQVDAPIGRAVEDPHRRIVKEDGAPSLTFYRVDRQFACGASELDIRLGTGRTHQIRVHMLHIGCPLIGDDYYTHERWRATALASVLRSVIGRQALHAKTLVFQHPVTGEELRLEAVLPHDLQQLQQKLTALPPAAGDADGVTTGEGPESTA